MKLTLFFVLVFSFLGASAQTKKTSAPEALGAKEPLKMDKGKNVWMLTYFRQRYPTRIEIDEKGNTMVPPKLRTGD